MVNKNNFKQKKGFLLRDFVITGLIFGMIVSLFVIMVGSVANNYNNQEIVSPGFAERYNQLSQNLDNLDTSFKATTDTGGLDLIGTFNIAFNSVFTVVNMVWRSLLLYPQMAASLAGDFTFLDSSTILMFLSGVIGILTAYLIFVWLSSVSRGKI